ncbi:chromate efflux transporter [Luteibacter yeojuensis]|uniref:Chromate efflux transporter n=1 Tax=Luteibacter yeojuensis TaxID=345309 RepID=A0A7X5TP37_9GAMM|nr:chromate efflux transporter [Luteibacter yeojuensis]NID14630.1 chromate efflux transporter [Luteibacter yeojuensis]
MTLPTQQAATGEAGRGTVREVAAAFLKLGMSSFGGPIAHLGYFHREFVERRRWLDERHYGHLVALCQFLPGPASSQVGFSIGLIRAGWLGGLAAFLCFTLPSALLLLAFASLSDRLHGPLGTAAIHGLKLVAVAVVAQGVHAMAGRLAPDRNRALLAAAAAGLVVVGNSAPVQLGVVAGGAVLGLGLCRNVEHVADESFPLTYGRGAASVMLFGFAVLLLLALFASPRWPDLVQVGAGFYRSGSLVFGGGHVVLPLLQHDVVGRGWVSNDAFLAGYGAAQAVPGPMFSVAAYLGDQVHGGRGGLAGAGVGLLGIFLPGLLLVAGALPLWRSLARREAATRMLAGVNAAVVGLLAAALYNPVWISAVRSPLDVAIALVGFAMLAGARWSPLAAVFWCVTASIASTLAGWTAVV